MNAFKDGIDDDDFGRAPSLDKNKGRYGKDSDEFEDLRSKRDRSPRNRKNSRSPRNGDSRNRRNSREFRGNKDRSDSDDYRYSSKKDKFDTKVKSNFK